MSTREIVEGQVGELYSPGEQDVYLLLGECRRLRDRCLCERVLVLTAGELTALREARDLLDEVLNGQAT